MNNELDKTPLGNIMNPDIDNSKCGNMSLITLQEFNNENPADLMIVQFTDPNKRPQIICYNRDELNILLNDKENFFTDWVKNPMATELTDTGIGGIPGSLELFRLVDGSFVFPANLLKQNGKYIAVPFKKARIGSVRLLQPDADWTSAHHGQAPGYTIYILFPASFINHDVRNVPELFEYVKKNQTQLEKQNQRELTNIEKQMKRQLEEETERRRQRQRTNQSRSTQRPTDRSRTTTFTNRNEDITRGEPDLQNVIQRIRLQSHQQNPRLQYNFTYPIHRNTLEKVIQRYTHNKNKTNEYISYIIEYMDETLIHLRQQAEIYEMVDTGNMNDLLQYPNILGQIHNLDNPVSMSLPNLPYIQQQMSSAFALITLYRKKLYTIYEKNRDFDLTSNDFDLLNFANEPKLNQQGSNFIINNITTAFLNQYDETNNLFMKITDNDNLIDRKILFKTDKILYNTIGLFIFKIKSDEPNTNTRSLDLSKSMMMDGMIPFYNIEVDLRQLDTVYPNLKILNINGIDIANNELANGYSSVQKLKFKPLLYPVQEYNIEINISQMFPNLRDLILINVNQIEENTIEDLNQLRNLTVYVSNQANIKQYLSPSIETLLERNRNLRNIQIIYQNVFFGSVVKTRIANKTLLDKIICNIPIEQYSGNIDLI